MDPTTRPGGAVVRAAVPADAAAIARVQVASWRDAYRGIVPDAFLDGMREEEWAARRLGNLEAGGTTTLVAEEEGRIVAFACGGAARRAPGGFDAEVYALYVLRDRRRRGLGRLLLLLLADALAARGAISLVLWVLRDNAPGRAFYEGLGGRVVAAKEIEIGGASLPEVAYGWADLASLRARSG